MVDSRQPLQRLAGSHQHAAPQQAACGAHLNRRNRQTDRAGTGDDQHADRRHHGPGRVAAEQPPADEGRQRRPMHHGRPDGGDPISQDSGPPAPRLGGFDQPHHGGQVAVIRRAHDARCQQTPSVGGPRQHGVARPDGGGQALARDQADVQVRAAIDHHRIRRAGLARTDAHRHAGRQGVDADCPHRAIWLHDLSRGGPQGGQPLHGGPRPFPGGVLEPAPDQKHEQKGQGAVEIDVGAAPDRLDNAHGHRQDHAQADRHVHIGAPRLQGAPGRAIEGAASIENGGRRHDHRQPLQQVLDGGRHVVGLTRPDRDRQHHDVGRREPRHGQGFQQFAGHAPLGLVHGLQFERRHAIARAAQTPGAGVRHVRVAPPFQRQSVQGQVETRGDARLGPGLGLDRGDAVGAARALHQQIEATQPAFAHHERGQRRRPGVHKSLCHQPASSRTA